MESILIIAFGLVLLLVVFLIYRSIDNLRRSFSKLGYLARRDAKEYFDEAAKRAIKMYRGVSKEEQELVKEAISRALQKENKVLKEIIVQTQERSAQIIAKAQKEAEGIINEAESQSKKILKKCPAKAAEATQWALTKFVKKEYSLNDHEGLIRNLVELYLKDHNEI